jgi:hypothetical protein
MKPKNLFLIVMAATISAAGQGTFIYDQQSAIENAIGESGGIIQNSQPFGQSFTPGSNSISFIRLLLGDINPGNGLGATVYVNLRSNSINGPIIASTDPTFMPDGFGSAVRGYTNFFFASGIWLTPGVTYFFQPVAQSGDSWAVIGDSNYRYTGGTMYVHGSPPQFGNFDLWFREGIYVVPEPSALSLLISGGVLFYVRHKKIEKHSAD